MGIIKWGLGLASNILGIVNEPQAKGIVDAINAALPECKG